MAAISNLIADALKTAGIVGVGQQALAEDTNLAFRLLNRLLAEWRRQRRFVYHTQDVSFVATGALSYTIGSSGADVIAARPARIEAGFVRQLIPNGTNLTDRPLKIFNDRADYNRIAAKTVGPYPYCVFYDATYPKGTIYPYPVPNSQYEIHLTVLGELTAFTSLNDNFNFPDEYENALFWNLTKNLRTAYRRPMDAAINQEAKNSRDIITKANLSIPELVMPTGIPLGPPRYNILTDQGS